MRSSRLAFFAVVVFLAANCRSPRSLRLVRGSRCSLLFKTSPAGPELQPAVLLHARWSEAILARTPRVQSRTFRPAPDGIKRRSLEGSPIARNNRDALSRDGASA